MGAMSQLAAMGPEPSRTTYEEYIDACAEEMGVSKREFIDHMDRDYYMATVQPVELDEETENLQRR